MYQQCFVEEHRRPSIAFGPLPKSSGTHMDQVSDKATLQWLMGNVSSLALRQFPINHYRGESKNV